MTDASRSRLVRGAIQAATTIAALAAMAWLLYSRRSELASLPKLGLLVLVEMSLVTLAAYAVGGVQLRELLVRFETRISWAAATAVAAAGYALNYLPLKAGTVLQGAALKGRWRVRLTHFAALSAAGQLVSLWSAGTLAGACTLLAHGSMWLGVLLLVTPSACLAGLMLWGRRGVAEGPALPANRFARALAEAFGGMTELFGDPGMVAILVACNIGSLLLGSARLWLIFGALGSPISPYQAIVIGAFALAAYLLGLLPGGVLFREGGIVVGAALVGVGPEVALAAGIIDRGIDIVWVLLAGVPSAIWMGRYTEQPAETVIDA